MHIGETIRKFRKQQNLTQEEVARRLNVTPPAVNKWEHGASTPDVTLLAPLARLLGISCDTLLAYRENLTETELNLLLAEAKQRLAQNGLAATLQWAKKQRAEYPNCQLLALRLAQLLDAWRVVQNPADLPAAPAFDDWLLSCWQQALSSNDEEIRTTAADCLFNFYLRQGQTAEAENCLQYFSQQNPDYKQKQALLFRKTNRLPQAWQAYEELLFSLGNRMSLILHELFLLATQENDAAKAQLLTKKQAALAHLLDKGAYNEAVCGLDYAFWQQDAAACLDILELLLANCSTICDFIDSPLFSHMQFKRPKAETYANIRQKLLASMHQPEQYEFIKDNPAAYARWQKLLQTEETVTENNLKFHAK